MNSSASMTTSTISPIHGRCAPTEETRSTVFAVRPPTSALPEAGSMPRSCFTTSWERCVWLLPSQVARSSVVSPARSTGRTATTPSTALTRSTYAATSAGEVPDSRRLALDRSAPKSWLSLSAATWAGASGGSTR